MSSSFLVFTGLGSSSIFSQKAFRQAKCDAAAPECAVLLQSCYMVFRQQISEATHRRIIGQGIVDLEDFKEPLSLTRPASKYHQNAIIQHITLYLHQIMRYMVCRHDLGNVVGSVGICTGLLPAAVVTAGSLSAAELISRARDFFQVALCIGIRCEGYRRNRLTSDTPRFNNVALPCSYVVDGGSIESVTELLTRADVGNNVFVSAVLSPTRVTLSGIPWILSSFIADILPAEYRTTPLAVYSLYHNRRLLQGERDQVLEDLSLCDNLLQTKLSVTTPLLSTASGEQLAISPNPTLEEIVGAILDLIFLEKLDFVSVQSSIASHVGRVNSALPVSIVNFGPGLGMSSVAARNACGDHVNVRDAANILPQSTATNHSKLDLDDIAIVGVAVDLPGAPDLDALWTLLVNGNNTTTEIPTKRFNINDYNSQSAREGKRSLNTKFGSFLENPFLFDTELFNISPREAKSMDPQQRILLQTAYRALEDAGYVPDATPSFARGTFGCWIGNATLDYADNLRNDIDVYYSTGTLRAFLSARLSYVFGWSGPSITLDTACSSSLVALHQASRSILMGDCRAALVGGINVITSPDMYLGLDRAHFLSPSGQCKAFDASADGYCRAEGCGVFVIKKLSDALVDGDRIHATIKAVEINQSGNTHSITHPHVPTQEALFEKMFRKSNIDPHEISVVEMHGTGTQAGDPNEVESVRRVLCRDRDPENLVHLTSIKGNLGHTEAASGIAGLVKLILMMKHEYIPPQVSLKNINPRIRPLAVDGAVIDTKGAAWPRTALRRARVGMINNFGAGGSNAAAIICEHIASDEPVTRQAGSVTTFVCGLSAKSERAIDKLRDNLSTYLTSTLLGQSPPLISDVCATLTSRRQLYDNRVTVTASSLTELVHKLRDAVPHNVSKSMCPIPEAVFLFSGQGSQYLGMGRELMELYGDFAETVNTCDAWLLKNKYPGCAGIIQADRNENGNEPPDKTLWQGFQSAIFVLEVALAKLLLSWGIQPQAVAGHSLGEYAALVTAGVISMADGLKLVAHRARLMMELCELGQTSLLAVNGNSKMIEDFIKSSDGLEGLAIACDNSATDCVVGGPVPQLSQLKQQLTAVHCVKSKVLNVPFAFHTAAMDPIIKAFTAFSHREVQVSPPKIPVVSSMLGRTVAVGEPAFSVEYFAEQCRATVVFDAGIKNFIEKAAGDATLWRWIELGPHPSIQPMLRSRLSGLPNTQVLMPTLVRNASPSSTMAHLLQHLYETSSGVDWRNVFLPNTYHHHKLTDLPLMPFFQSEFYVPYHEIAERSEAQHVLNATSEAVTGIFALRAIQRLSPGLTSSRAIYETPIAPLKDYIEGHIVGGYALCPASVYHEMVLESLREAQPAGDGAGSWSLSEIQYSSPLVYDDKAGQLLRVIITPTAGIVDRHEFKLLSYTSGSNPEVRGTIHCVGIVKRKSGSSARTKYNRLQSSIRSSIDGLKRTMQDEMPTQHSAPSSSTLQIISRRVIYDLLFPRVVTYSERYQKVQTLCINEGTGQALATCVFPDAHLRSAGNVIFMDVLLHVAGFCANLKLPNDVLGICKETGSAIVLRDPAIGDATPASFDVYCSSFETQEDDGRSFTIADAYAVDANGLLAVFKGMVFQHVEKTRMSQALRTATRSSKSTATTASRTAVLKQSSEKLSYDMTHFADSVSLMPTNFPLRSPPSQLDIRSLVAKVCGQSADKLKPDSPLATLGVDSLITIELVADLSSHFGLDISMDAMASCITVGDVERLGTSLSPTPDGSSVATDSETPFSGTEYISSDMSSSEFVSAASGPHDVTKIIAELCGAEVATVMRDSELRALGIDSFMLLELSYRLEELYDCTALPSYKLQECNNVGDIEKLVNDHLHERSHESDAAADTSFAAAKQGEKKTEQTDQPSTTAASSSLELEAVLPKISSILCLSHQPENIQADPYPQGPSNCSPLFLVHDGSGICSHYRRLKPLGRRVLALHDPKFLAVSDEERSWSSLTAMAASYATIISSVTDSAAGEGCILGGWSFGGVVAFEAARILIAQGRDVKGVILIDSPPPVGHVPLSDAIISAVTTKMSAGASNGDHSGDSGSTMTASMIRKLVMRSFGECARLLGDFEPDGLPEQGAYRSPREVPKIVLLRCVDGCTPPEGLDDSELTQMGMPWLQDRGDRSLATAGWELLTGRPVQCVDIPGNHFQVFDAPNIDTVSAILSSACLDLD